MQQFQPPPPLRRRAAQSAASPPGGRNSDIPQHCYRRRRYKIAVLCSAHMLKNFLITRENFSADPHGFMPRPCAHSLQTRFCCQRMIANSCAVPGWFQRGQQTSVRKRHECKMRVPNATSLECQENKLAVGGTKRDPLDGSPQHW